ncbi:MAG: glycoside hydrolase family 2 TIM barrel-domain containing protein [Chloroherpetonaceae bacterium]|nr:glycoside hydrolase family 2 TIM barrel-domain containing protein [Chloroherpetonaceae bacterium]
MRLPDGTTSEVGVPSAFEFAGKVTYEKTFLLPKHFGSSLLTLVSEGMGNRCEIFFNDQFVGTHVGHSPFKMDIPAEMLRPDGENKLSIVCDSRLNMRTSFPLRSQAFDKKVYAGLFRNLYLVRSAPIRFSEVAVRYAVRDTLLSPNLTLRRTEPVDTQVVVHVSLAVSIKQFNLRGFQLTPDSLGRTTLRATAQLFLDTLPVTPSTELGQFEAESNRVHRYETTLQVLGAALWQPNAPVRYRLKLVLRTAAGDTLDDLEYRLGFRTVQNRAGALTLNHKPIFLKGIHLAEELPQAASVMSEQDILRDLLLARSTGANAIRFTDIPHPLTFELCDSLGLLVFLELPVRNLPTPLLTQSSFFQQAELALQETLSLTQFHPSVIGYGLGEGLDLRDARTEQYVQTLTNLVKAATGSLVYFAPKTLLSHTVWQHIDFIAFTDYGTSFEHFKQLGETAKSLASAEKPVLLLSYGVLAQPDNHNGYSDPRSLEHQAKFLLDRFRWLEDEHTRRSAVCGGFVHTLYDYHLAIAPILQASERDKDLATFGLCTLQREKKSSFQMLTTLYLGERAFNPPVGNPQTDFSPVLILVSVFLTAFFVYVLNGNKRFQETLQRALVRPVNLFMDIRDQRLYAAFDPLLMLTLLSLIWASLLAAFLYSLRYSEGLDFWLSHFFGASRFKEWLNVLIINPHLALLAFSVAFFVLILLLPLLVRLFITLRHRHCPTYLQLLNVCIWSWAQWVVLIFAAAFIERLEN